MDRTRLVNVIVVALLLVAAAMVLASPTGPLAPWLYPLDYGEATLTIHDENRTALGTVDVRIADTERERHIGLSKTDALEAGAGMLFLHPESGSYAYVMRNMSFPIDILFIDTEGQITEIHHAPVPADPRNPDRRYRGHGQYVLEVPYGWTNETGIAVGDRVDIPDSVHD
ncbi:DUF192 domain-containing protein [Halorhabdus sp. CBA1104]|uniref:DUF192 domain-containing protein n=1 Tax=Halorhabdus sp. CBA1104 TaxID=1380432 RepID=UPI001E457B01|nr:DUF192 domain-containing protein [Halorhabdus sp. CBA1104]